MERHLRAKVERGCEAAPEPFEKPDVGNVSDRIAIWIEADGDFQTYRRSQPTELLDRHLVQFATLEPTVLTTGYANRGTGLVSTESLGDTSPTYLADRLLRLAARRSECTLEASVPGRHALTLPPCAYLPIYRVPNW